MKSKLLYVFMLLFVVIFLFAIYIYISRKEQLALISVGIKQGEIRSVEDLSNIRNSPIIEKDISKGYIEEVTGDDITIILDSRRVRIPLTNSSIFSCVDSLFTNPDGTSFDIRNAHIDINNHVFTKESPILIPTEKLISAEQLRNIEIKRNSILFSDKTADSLRKLIIFDCDGMNYAN